MPKILLIVLDGLADTPSVAMGNRTCLEAAPTPLMDRLAREGACGLVRPYQRGLYPTSEDTHFSLFGYNVDEYKIGRGVFEALGLGVDLDEGEVAWRGNWATLDKSGSLINRRAGRIPACRELLADIKELNIDGINFRIYPGNQHRLVVVMRGVGLSDQISDGYRRQLGVRPPLVTPLDQSEESFFTARAVNRYLEEVAILLKNNPVNKDREKDGLLPANYILIRGAGRIKPAPSFQERWGWSGAAVAGGHLYQGIAKFLGMEIMYVSGVSVDTDTNLAGQIEASLEIIPEKDFVFCHIKAADNLGHDRNCLAKADFLTEIDRHLEPILKRSDLTLIITGDHATPCELGEHSRDLIPILVWGSGIEPDQVDRFGESFAQKGRLGIIEQVEVLDKIAKMMK